MLMQEGWQFKITYYKKHVIKTPKTYKEIRKSVSNCYRKKSKEEIDKITRRAIKDYNDSLKILKKSNCPKKLLGNPKFLKNKKVKQDRAVVLQTRLNNLVKKNKTKEAKIMIDKYILLTLELWKYGIYEKVYKFTINNGVINNRVILLDLFELNCLLAVARSGPSTQLVPS